MNDAERLGRYVDAWALACADFVGLARSLSPEQLLLETDLPGWSVFDNVAHVAHLEHVLATGEEETIEIEAGPHVKDIQGWYTEQGVVARRGRRLEELVDEIETAVALRSASLAADPPTDGSAPPPRTPAGVPWSNETLLGNRPLDVWMHGQDIRRAIGRPGGYDSPAALHTIRQLGRSLPFVLGKRVKPPIGTSVRVEILDADISLCAVVGEDGRARADEVADPTATIALSAESFVLLAGGRRGPDQVEAAVSGDVGLGREVLENLAVTP